MGSLNDANLNHFQVSTTSSPVRKRSELLALSVQNAYKTYSKKKDVTPILNNFSMSVKRGHIYSLLGSSGCGKTTLLSCVVGLRRVDSGSITVFGMEPGKKGSGIPGRRVGYMPQEIALYGQFSIQEIMLYFGRLYGMPRLEVEDNTKFLTTFLKLPPMTRRINSLSGGQQRRVSFAVALVHNPELLILDEPTVGVDPLLRQSIWTHLVKLASTTKTTVIITTHFIEEARDSNCIGLMRNGKLLVEDSPANLMNRYNTYILEDIVVQLCLRDNSNEENIAHEQSETSAQPSLKSLTIVSLESNLSQVQVDDGPDLNSRLEIEVNGKSPIKRRISLGQVLHRASASKDLVEHDSSMRTEIKEKGQRIYALLNKNVLVLFRNIVLVLFIVGLPAVQVTLMCLAIGNDPHDIKLGVVNNEVEAEMCLNVPPKPGCVMGSKYGSYGSCQFMAALNPLVFILIPYASIDDALDDVRLTKIWGVMSFPHNFTGYLKDRLIFGVYTETESLIGSRITFDLDMSNKQVGMQIQKNLYETLRDFMTGLAKDCKVDTSGMDTPLNFPTPVYGNSDTNFTDFLAPGILLAILFFFPLCSTGVSMIGEKKSGALERTKTAGVTDLELMISHFVTQFVLLLCQSAISYAIMISLFKIEVQGSIPLAYSIGVVIGVSGISFGFVMASLCNDELEAVMVSFGTFLPNFIMSGVMWPLEGMPFYLRNLAYVLPCTMAGETLRSIIGRGQSFTHPSVWPGFFTTFCYTCLYWIVTLIIFRIRNKK